ncbi:VOC family protein [Streptomyces sp. NBC_01443]|uniref:VOC family protein n=1 Tax=Streptomyces sp. NBC_01443 TaxID=2903868 RepID=UPI00224C8E2E|nr:VOC family protein [Streptomyces sp. NBC_01443]MCX4633261.1 VOC family protein [Streptomyces sp. NBC_01443]
MTASTLSLTVADVAASRDFFCTHLGYAVAMAADGFASLTRGDDAADIVLLRRGSEVLPPEQRDRQATGLIFALTVAGIEAEERRLREAGAPVTMPLREEPWGERLFQLTDPNGIVVQLVEWATPDESAQTEEDPAMLVITPTAENVTESPNARMTGLAAPSRGSTELSTWTVAMEAGRSGPEHSVSREQVWTVTAGVLEVTCGGRTEKIAAGQTLVLPPEALRQVHAPQAAEAHVAMRADGVVSVPGTEGTRVLPWAR